MLFGVLRRMTNSFWRSLVVAALFAVHPLHVESVAWVSERKDVLCTFFLLLTLAAYARYTARPGLVRYAWVACAMALGLLAKPMLVSLPFLLLLLDYWPLRRLTLGQTAARTVDEIPGETAVVPYPPVPWRGLVWEKLPLLALAIASSVITIIAQKSGGAVQSIETLPLESRAANAVQAYGWYLGKAVWPFGLAVYYPHPRQSLTVLGTVGAALLLLAISFVVLRSVRSRGYAIVGWLWFLGTLVPVIGLLQVGSQAYADRYAYVPHIGLFMMLVWGASEGLNRRHVRTSLSLLLAALVMAAGTVRTKTQVAYWHDVESLMSHALDVVDENHLAHLNLGALRLRQRRFPEAEVHLEAALRGWPHSSVTHLNLGVLRVNQGRFEEAERLFEASLKIDDQRRMALYGLAQLRERQQRWQEAGECYAEFVQLHPDHWQAQHKWGLLLLKQEQTEQAISQFSLATRINPNFVAAHHSLASTLAQVGRRDEAKPHLVKALQINPNSVDAHYLMGTILKDERDFDQAKERYAQALRLRPNHAEAADRLRRLPNPL